MSRHFRAIPGLILILLATAAQAGAATRSFDFTYAFTVTQLAPGKAFRIWIPSPRDDAFQTVHPDNSAMPQQPMQIHEDSHGNQIVYLKSKAGADGSASFSFTYRITRRETSETPRDASEDDAPFLRGDQLVPIGGAPQKLMANQALPADQMELGHLIYNIVDDHLQYRKDKPGWGHGDAVWACSSGFGNCTDFHSLFISLARTAGLPAKFEIGFAIPAKPAAGAVAGYHCWAYFKPAGHGWVPVDISEANLDPSKRDYYFGHLDENRVAFTDGRDLELVPKQDGPPINFLIYPYVEVDGKPYPAEKIQRCFAYRDAPANDEK